MNENDIKKLISQAFEAMQNAYTPYSGFNVGAALLCENGKVYKGCNIECATFSPTNCAERTALFKAVSEGERKFSAIAIVAKRTDGHDDGTITSPCGVCRQMLYEFCTDDMLVVMAKSETDYKAMTLGELLPHGFGPHKLL